MAAACKLKRSKLGGLLAELRLPVAQARRAGGAPVTHFRLNSHQLNRRSEATGKS